MVRTGDLHDGVRHGRRGRHNGCGMARRATTGRLQNGSAAQRPAGTHECGRKANEGRSIAQLTFVIQAPGERGIIIPQGDAVKLTRCDALDDPATQHTGSAHRHGECVIVRRAITQLTEGVAAPGSYTAIRAQREAVLSTCGKCLDRFTCQGAVRTSVHQHGSEVVGERIVA